MPARDSEETMIAYLLDELPESEAIHIEQEYLANDDALALLMAVESELYDAYARNALSPDRRRKFETKFLATAEQRHRLQFSRTLLQLRRRGRLNALISTFRKP